MFSQPRTVQIINLAIVTRPESTFVIWIKIDFAAQSLRATLLIGGSIDVQWSMHLHSFAHIYTYAASNKHKNKKISIENIYIWSIYMYL